MHNAESLIQSPEQNSAWFRNAAADQPRLTAERRNRASAGAGDLKHSGHLLGRSRADHRARVGPGLAQYISPMVILDLFPVRQPVSTDHARQLFDESGVHAAALV